MISSEVQRTLVKSPPELWTELSDPEALSRHLGALGEIRITRTEPEKLIEWEAEGTKGTVAIKPSGWGTKVTLSVRRELPAEGLQGEGADEAAGEPAEAEQALATEEPGEAEPAAAAEGGPDDAAHAETPELLAEEPAHAETPDLLAEEPDDAETPEAALAVHAAVEEAVAAQPSEPAPAEPRASVPEVKPAPATEAARRAAGWPAPSEPEGPAIESGLRAAEGSQPEDTMTVPEWPAPKPAASEPAPRQGFFARLFGRRRKVEAPAFTPASATDVLASAPTEADPEPADEPLEVIAVETADAQPEAVAGPDAEEPLAEGTAQDESAVEEPAPGTEEPALDGPVTGEPTSGEPAPAEADIAAELAAAEEVAAEEVTAVLTGVLDRLGAAHHRPFSRA